MSDFFKIKLQFILGYAGILLVLISINPIFLTPIIFSSDKIDLSLYNILVVHLILVIIAIVFYGMIFVNSKFNKKNLPKLFGDIFYLLSFLWILFVLIGYLVLLFLDNYSYYLNRKTIPPLLFLSFIIMMMILFFNSNKFIKKVKVELLEYINSNNHIEHVKLESKYKTFYRMLDILISCGTILLFSPIFLISYLLLKLESKANSIQKINKIGKNGKEFYMYKFRTSFIDNSGPSKISKLGLFFRRSSIDELPILFNILLNNMTLVGPRPLSIISLEKFDQDYKNIYKRVKPGILSLTSIVIMDQSFKNVLDLQGIAKIETFYISNKTFYTDFMLVLSAAKLILFTKK